MEIYNSHGNVQLLGKLKIQNKSFDNLQLFHLLTYKNYIDFESIDQNYYAYFDGYLPIIGIKSNTNNYYTITNQVEFVQETIGQIKNKKTKVDIRPFLIAQNQNSFSGIWTVYLNIK